ncbi:MAG: FixH family protein [Cyclobacteriaceae bacterium]|nr:FixH family protein [Cyclobacteriaceae bacterium]
MKWIVISFVLFIAFIVGLLVVGTRGDIGLVSSNYYAEELKHNEKMIQLENTQRLTEQPQFKFKEHSVVVDYSALSKMENGKLTVLRPSDSRLDHAFEITEVKGENQSFELKVWEPGLYRVSLTWTMEGKDYYIEKLMVL